MISTDFAAAQVPFLVYDLTDLTATPPGTEPGFYWSIPLPGDDKSTEIALDGPCRTRQDAINAATAFIRDALTDSTGEQS
jgi:hypothetical protein